MKRAIVVLNPVAGKGEGLSRKPWLIERLDQMELQYKLQVSQSEGEIEQIARNLDEKETDLLIVVGGDGSLVEAVNGLIGKSIALAVLPMGTGNDFVRSLEDKIDPETVLRAIETDSLRSVDVGMTNDRFFINVTGFGIDSYILANMEKIKRFFGGSAAYFVSTIYTLLGYRSQRVRIRFDDQDFEKDVMLTAICNGRYFGGGMMISPNSCVDDGLFDLVIVRKLGKLKFIRLFKRVYKGTHIEVDEVEVYRSSRFVIESETEIPINVDGNLYGTTPLEVRVTAHRIQMYV